MEYADKTIQYYTDTGKEYARKRGDDSSDSIPLLKRFQVLVPGNKVLEIGFGLGFDAMWFSRQGFSYTGVDPVHFFNKRLARKLPEAVLLETTIQEADFQTLSFDGIWAMASLLHLNNDDLRKTFVNFDLWLNNAGILFAAFKEGRGSRVGKDGRFFNLMSQPKLEGLSGGKFEVIDCFTEPPKPYNTGPENWINFYLRKK